MKINRKLILLIVFACLICVVGHILYTFLMRDRLIAEAGRAHREASTINRLQALAHGIQRIVRYKNERPPKNIESLSEYLRSHMDYRDFGWFEPNTGVIIDSWGTPVSLVVKTPEEYTFISAGSNRKNENGNGDDLVYTFDPFDLTKKPKIIVEEKIITEE